MACLIVVATILTGCRTVVGTLHGIVYLCRERQISVLQCRHLSLRQVGVAIDKLGLAQLDSAGSYVGFSNTACHGAPYVVSIVLLGEGGSLVKQLRCASLGGLQVVGSHYPCRVEGGLTVRDDR